MARIIWEKRIQKRKYIILIYKKLQNNKKTKMCQRIHPQWHKTPFDFKKFKCFTFLIFLFLLVLVQLILLWCLCPFYLQAFSWQFRLCFFAFRDFSPSFKPSCLPRASPSFKPFCLPRASPLCSAL